MNDHIDKSLSSVICPKVLLNPPIEHLNSLMLCLADYWNAHNQVDHKQLSACL